MLSHYYNTQFLTTCNFLDNIDINELFHSRIVTPANAFNMDYQLEQLNINEQEPEPETLPEPEPQPEKQTTAKRPMKGATAANKRLRRPKVFLIFFLIF